MRRGLGFWYDGLPSPSQHRTTDFPVRRNIFHAIDFGARLSECSTTKQLGLSTNRSTSRNNRFPVVRGRTIVPSVQEPPAADKRLPVLIDRSERVYGKVCLGSVEWAMVSVETVGNTFAVPGSGVAFADPPLPLLVTGVAGVAGYNAFRYFESRFPGRVIGTRRVENWRLCGPGIAACDIHDRDGMRRLFDRHQFASVLHAEGTCKLKSTGPGNSTGPSFSRSGVFRPRRWRPSRGRSHRSGDGLRAYHGGRRAIVVGAATVRLRLANLAANGRKLQWARWRHRLDPIPFSEAKAGDAVLR